jgi:DNA polymerase-3 subunit delta'
MARILDRLVGHRDTLAPLLASAAQGRLAPTLLFTGPSGVGKRLAAHALAQQLVCERVGESACGECGSCLRIEKAGSENLLQIAPDGQQIKIEQAREVLQFIALRALGRARIVIIDQAHLLNPQAANALLKSLEEPPSATYFILVTPLAAGVLPTIRSRSQIVRFRPLSDVDLRTVIGESADEWVLESASGSVEAASHLLENRAEFVELEDSVAQYLAVGVASLPVEQISRLKDQMKEQMKDRSSHGFVAGIILGVLRDALRVQAGVRAASGARYPEIVEVIRHWPKELLIHLSQCALEMEHDFARNLDRALVLENFAIQWRQSAARAASVSQGALT